MGYYPPSSISNGGWEYHQENTNSKHSNPWRFASETQDEQENHMGYFPPPQNDASHDSNGGWEGNSNAPYDIHPKISSIYHASTESPFQNLPPTQTSNSQRLSKLESMLKRFVEEKEKYQKELENSLKNMEVKVAQLLSATKKEEGLMEQPIQKAVDEENTPKITQQPCLEFKEVKAINKSTVTKIPRITFKRRSTTSNPIPGPLASKLNQAIYKRKLVEERPRQGTIAESSPPLRSILLTNWKKRKKVKNNMPTLRIIFLLCFVFFLCFV
ncbi:hypothetical protein AHAS_Ahas13G0210100 [Arachis hypogaea]